MIVMLVFAASSSGRPIARIAELQSYSFQHRAFFVGEAAVGALRSAAAERGLPLPIVFCIDESSVCPGMLVERRSPGASCPTLALAEMKLEDAPPGRTAFAMVGEMFVDCPGIEPLVDALLVGHQPDPDRRRELLRAAAVRELDRMVSRRGGGELGQLMSAAAKVGRGHAGPRELELLRRAISPGPGRFALTASGIEEAIAVLALAIAGDRQSLPQIARATTGANQTPYCAVLAQRVLA
jgi:hypothetical protein